MNKELLGKMIAQATTIEEHYPAGCNGHPEHWCYFNKEKFAELIVKECAKVASHAENNDTEFRCMHEIITNHFGVE